MLGSWHIDFWVSEPFLVIRNTACLDDLVRASTFFHLTGASVEISFTSRNAHMTGSCRTSLVNSWDHFPQTAPYLDLACLVITKY
jgi:hypothetical protein